MITIAAFSQATEEADSGIAVFRESLQGYVDGLKKITHNFCNDYMNSFSVEYDIQREKNCVDKGKIINDTLWENFGTAKKQLTNAIAGKLDSLCTRLCKSFEDLVEQEGLFDKVVENTSKQFRKCLSDQVLDGLRDDIGKKYTETNKYGFLVDKLDQTKFNNILLNDFNGVEKDCLEQLDVIVDGLYGTNLKDENANFPQDLSYTVSRFNATTIARAGTKIMHIHENVTDLISFGAGVASNVNVQIAEVQTAIVDWNALYKVFLDIGAYLVRDGSGIINKLADEYSDAVIKGKPLADRKQ